MNLRAVGWLLGCVTLIVAAFLLVPMGVALLHGELAHARAFALSAAISALVGLVLLVRNRGSIRTVEGRPDFYRREGLAVVGLAWVVAGMAGALPYVLSGAIRPPIDAFFESVSGFTTTGATILPGESIQGLSRSLGFWRCFTQWLGGFGIVMVFVILFPTGGRNLFRSEVPGIAREAGLARVRDSAIGLMRVYLAMSALQVLLLLALGLSWFDALVHTFATISTGGFSPYGQSVAAFGSWAVQLLIVGFMFAAGINFGLYDQLLRVGPSRGIRRFLGSIEVRVFAALVLGSTLLVGAAVWIAAVPDARESPARALLDSGFSVVSILTTTGFATADFDTWPQLARVWLMILAVIGGCAGSTAGGLKVVRLVVVAKAALLGIRRFVRPRGVYGVHLDGQQLEEGAVLSISGFFVLWVLVFLSATVSMAAFGIDLESSATAVIATLNNVGPGLGAVGPSQHFGGLPEPVKLLLSLCMILGRLEFYAVVALFIPSFWRR